MPTAVERIERPRVEAFIEHLLKLHSRATAANRYRSLKQLFNWLEEEGEVKRSAMTRMRMPKVPEQPVDVIGRDGLRALLAVREGLGVRPALRPGHPACAG